MISARHLLKIKGFSHVVSPFVKIRITGAKSDKKEVTLKSVSHNGFNPIWQEQVAEFRISNPDAASLIFGIFDKETNGTNIMPKSKKGKIGVGLGSIAGVGLVVGATIATGGMAAPLAVAGLTVAGAAVAGGAAAGTFQRSRLAIHMTPVKCIQEGYRVIELRDNSGETHPLFDALVKVTITKLQKK